MANSIFLVYCYIMLIGLVAQAILLALQWRTYRSTGHASLRTIAIATVLGFVYIAISYATFRYSRAGHNPLTLYLLSAAVLTLQMAIGIAGVRSLFRAFEQASASQRDGA